MSLWSNLLKTYDGIESSTGIVPLDKEGNPQVKKALLPLFHMTFPTRLHVALDADGNCINITRDAKDVTIIAPCTEASMGRAGSNPAPHPLCDQLQYIDSALDKKKFGQYVEQLDTWKGDDVKLNAISAYLSHHSVVADACSHGIYERNEDGIVALPKGEEKAGVRFSVRDPDSPENNVWEDKTLWKRWVDYETGDKPAEGRDCIGGVFRAQAGNYPKNIVGTAGNAKLVSANDSSNFTFRGRFSSQDEASRIDSMTSQKAHAALKWLVNNNGTITDKQAIVIWAVGKKPRIPLPFGNSYVVEQETEAYLTDTEILSQAKSNTDNDYAKRFGALVQGFGSNEKVKKHPRTVVVSIFDSATTGRLSLTYYQELPEDQYLESIDRWHKDSSWPLMRFDNPSAESQQVSSLPHKPIEYFGAPSYLDIVNCIYGPGEKSGNSYNRLKTKVEKQLIQSMFSNSSLPRGLALSAFNNVIRPASYEKENQWKHDIEITCSIWKKIYIQNGKGMTMELDEQRQDRDYLYGRLLALADHLERGVLWKQNVDRPTTAVKLMTNFVAKPYTTWGNIMLQLAPYIKSLNGSQWFQNDIDEVMVRFKDGDFEDNRPLSPLYLLGYSQERRKLQKKPSGNEKLVNNKN